MTYNFPLILRTSQNWVVRLRLKLQSKCIRGHINFTISKHVHTTVCPYQTLRDIRFQLSGAENNAFDLFYYGKSRQNVIIVISHHKMLTIIKAEQLWSGNITFKQMPHKGEVEVGVEVEAYKVVHLLTMPLQRLSDLHKHLLRTLKQGEEKKGNCDKSSVWRCSVGRNPKALVLGARKEYLVIKDVHAVQRVEVLFQQGCSG